MTHPTPLDALHAMRDLSGPSKTQGLPDETLVAFLQKDPLLAQAIGEAWTRRQDMTDEEVAWVQQREDQLTATLQEDYVNFYPDHAVNPYAPLAARGPWIVTAHGAVLHDSGGYGMLGFGHAPQAIIDQMSKPWVIANIMTPSFSQKRFAAALRREVGHSRGGCPFAAFLCMNSGSESVSVAARISDIHAKTRTTEGAPMAGRTVKFLALSGGFHGRTGRPAQASGSSNANYRKYLASFNTLDNLVLTSPNDVAELEATFAQAEEDGVFFEMMLMEPVMGEGNPGMPITRAFYDRARELTRKMGSFLLVDSIQAGLRAQGCLSIVDYPDFTDAEPPDMETYSKALNGAQYPLSVLAMTREAADTYQRGVYGNTMTGNPRACEVGAATLALVDDALRQNVRDRGAEFVAELTKLKERFPGLITKIQGTGLLLAAELDPSIPVVGRGGLEEQCRRAGIGVIHGGKNALRFTPHFQITSGEIKLVIDRIGQVIEAVLKDEEAAAK